MQNNLISGNLYNFGASGHNDVDVSNLVDEKPIYYLIGESDIIIDSSSNAGTVYCINCDNITIYDLILKNNCHGIYFYNTNSSQAKNNQIVDCENGIYIESSSSNIISKNYANDNEWYGIDIYESSNSTITNNNVGSNNYNGIFLYSSSNNSITNNNASGNNYNGITLSSSGNSTITNNNVSSNNYNGIILYFELNTPQLAAVGMVKKTT